MNIWGAFLKVNDYALCIGINPKNLFTFVTQVYNKDRPKKTKKNRLPVRIVGLYRINDENVIVEVYDDCENISRHTIGDGALHLI
jgi:hypothetical protein